MSDSRPRALRPGTDACAPGTDARAGQRGFTMMEIMIVAVLMPIVFLAILTTLDSSQRVQAEITRSSHGIDKLRTTLRRISDELRVASVLGEDRDDDGALTGTEDLNGNGLIEKDWAVADDSITFNRFLPDGTFSLATTYRLVGSRLVREQALPGGGIFSATIAESVDAFSVIATGSKVDISMSVDDGEQTQTSTITVILRN